MERARVLTEVAASVQSPVDGGCEVITEESRSSLSRSP